eukprot:g11271.t1
MGVEPTLGFTTGAPATVKHFDKYSRKGGRWSWKRPSYERGVVSLVKTERRIEEGIASALTEVEAVEAGLRYFDELIMPPNKTSSTNSTTGNGDFCRPPALPAPPAGHFPLHREQNPATGPPERKAKGRQGAVSRAKDGERGGGGFSRLQEASGRDYRAAKNTGVGRGSRISSSTDRAVSECGDLKLTLKQRLDNYDRQRGITFNAAHEDGTSPASPVPIVQGRENDDGPHGAKPQRSNLGAACSSGAAGSGEVQGGGALAPCLDGGTLDNGGSVAQILARSLGNAAAAVRRSRPCGGREAEGRRSPSKSVGVGAGVDGDGKGRRQNPDRSAVRSRWRSWNEAPPDALLTAQEIRSASSAKQGDDRRRQRPPADVVAEVVPPLHTRRRFTNGTGNSGNPDGKKDLPETSAPVLSGAAASATSATAAKGPPTSEARRRGSKEEGPPSKAPSASSRRSSAGGVPLVPRVAMLAAASTVEKNHAGAARKGKDFDPDQLECVRRHEASVVEKERRVRNLRTEEEKRTLFRARPLPGFLESGGGPADSGGRGASGAGGGVGQKGRRDLGTVTSATTGVAGTTPELLAALEQDEEARALAEKIRKINPRADIAAIVLQSTPRAPAPSQISLNSIDGGSGSTWFPSSRGTAPTTAVAIPRSFPAKVLTSKSFSGGDGSPMPSLMSLSGGEGASAATMAARSGGSDTKLPERRHSRDVTANVETKSPRSPGNRNTPSVGIGSSSPPRERPEQDSSNAENGSPASKGGTSQSVAAPPPPAAARLAGSVGEEDGVGRSSADSRRRSLMGRMLGSGMLERQREWAKARNKKVLESRRRVEEAKEREAKGDTLDAGRSGRSWSKAKTEHLRSLQRQREEEEAREQIQEARRRASEVRAERERRLAEQRAAELAQTLTTAADPKEPPRRARSDVGDTRAVASTHAGGVVSPSGRGRRQRDDEPTRGGGEADSPAAAEGNKLMSEDSFYRVAVKKIMERERLGAQISEGHGHDGCARGSGGRSGGIRNGDRRRPHDEDRRGFADRMVFASPRGGVSGGPGRRKSLVAPRNRRKTSSATRAPLGQAARRRRPSEGKPSTVQGRSPFDINPAARPPPLSKEVTRTSSLLSLYEAQSVEHVPAGGGSATSGRDNSGPYLDDDGGTLLGLGGSVSGLSYGPAGTRGERTEHGAASPAARNRRQYQGAGEGQAGSAETGEGGDYPWSEEMRASSSRGRGGAAARHPVRGGVGFGAPTEDPGGDPRWDDVLENAELDGLSAVAIESGDGESGAIGGAGGYRGSELNAAITGSHGVLPLPAEVAGRFDRPEDCSQPSPRKRSSIQRRRENNSSQPRAAPHSAEGENQPHLNGGRHSFNGDLGGVDGIGGAGARFSLWSSSDEDASVTEVFGGDEGGDNEIGGAGYDVQDGRPSRLEPRSTAATGGYGSSGGAFASVMASSGSFFDTATSSADKGRYKVRDPRLFDPCSMRRRPDATTVSAPPPEAGGASSDEDGGGLTTHHFGDRASSSTGVTLLLGLRVEDSGGGDSAGEQQSERAEQVITVMFDRSKFNEQEARRWWTANRARIESIGDPRNKMRAFFPGLEDEAQGEGGLFSKTRRVAAAARLSVAAKLVDAKNAMDPRYKLRLDLAAAQSTADKARAEAAAFWANAEEAARQRDGFALQLRASEEARWTLKEESRRTEVLHDEIVASLQTMLINEQTISRTARADFKAAKEELEAEKDAKAGVEEELGRLREERVDPVKVYTAKGERVKLRIQPRGSCQCTTDDDGDSNGPSTFHLYRLVPAGDAEGVARSVAVATVADAAQGDARSPGGGDKVDVEDDDEDRDLDGDDTLVAWLAYVVYMAASWFVVFLLVLKVWLFFRPAPAPVENDNVVEEGEGKATGKDKRKGKGRKKHDRRREEHEYYEADKDCNDEEDDDDGWDGEDGYGREFSSVGLGHLPVKALNAGVLSSWRQRS